MCTSSQRNYMTLVKLMAQLLLSVALTVVAYWNIWGLVQRAANVFPIREADELVVLEERYRGIRETLRVLGYGRGPIRFITNRDLKTEPLNPDDSKRWGEGQYLMVPWILVRDHATVGDRMANADTSFIIADFWDGKPAQIPPDLVPLYDSGQGLILFQKKSLP